MKNAELYFYNSADLLECPIWDKKRNLIWMIEIRKNRIFALSPEDHSCKTYTMPSLVGWIALLDSGKLYAALKDGIYIFDPEDQSLEFIGHPEPDMRFRYNDGYIDPEGRILIGTKGDKDKMEGLGGLYQCRNGEWRKLISGTTTANGMGFSPDLKTFYFIDTPSKNIYSYDYDHSNGDVCNERIFATLTDGGMPDGMCVLPDGRICAAEYNGGKVAIFTPDGNLSDFIELPVTNVTSCCAAKNKLFITTAKHPDKIEPMAGGLFVAEFPKLNEKAIIYIHGKGGSISEAEHYIPLFKDCDVIGFDYTSQTPWEAKNEFVSFFDNLSEKYDSLNIIANSIGAFFAFSALSSQHIDNAVMISPIVDMEALIYKMMTCANVTEDELREKKEIPTEFGETLSYEYLTYVRKHPISWNIPTQIFYGDKDHMTDIEAITDFAKKTNAKLFIMKNGEHWFHTDEQMNFIDSHIEL